MVKILSKQACREALIDINVNFVITSRVERGIGHLYVKRISLLGVLLSQE